MRVLDLKFPTVICDCNKWRKDVLEDYEIFVEKQVQLVESRY